MTEQTPAQPTTAGLEARWRQIVQSGGIPAWIDAQLDARGLKVVREDASAMSKSRLKRYKTALKAEAAERRTLRRDAWAAYRATHIVHLGDGVYWNDAADIDRFDLDSPESRAAENELPALDSPRALADALDIDIPTLRWLTYHRDAAHHVHYQRFTIPKRDGSPRPIWAPHPKLKRIQRWILRHIVEQLPVHGAAHAFLPGRTVATNAARHTGSEVIVKMDLESFFPTVTFPRVKGVFRKAGYREQVATLLALLCTESPREVVEMDGKTWFVALGPRCLPQGAPTSPAITNTLCLRLDRRLSGLGAKLGFRYTRYADDLTFSWAPRKKQTPAIGPLIGGVKHITADEGFAVKDAKTRILRTGTRQTVTGLVVNGDGRPRVSRQLKRTLRAAIHNLEQGKGLHDGESMDSLLGYAAWVHMVEPDLGRRLLDRLRALG